ncbi:hypothetical protein [Methylomonas sp. AM2-LC]|uniref:hypothetical protein n=1 Tax=Methylomonas sp. AM2-LC TaxID=3153301 RepID=UPI003266C73D
MIANVSTKQGVYAALMEDILLAVTNNWAVNRVSLSQAIHGLVETGNQVLQIYVRLCATQPVNLTHTQGQVWRLMVSILIFALGVIAFIDAAALYKRRLVKPDRL